MAISFPKRITNIEQSPIRKLYRFAQSAKERGVKVYHLNIGQPDIKTPEEVIDAIRNIDMDILSYGPSEGLSEYRKALPSYYGRFGIDLSPEDIMVTTAGSEAALFLFLTLFEPSDEIIIPEPFYTNFRTLASIAGLRIRAVECTIENNFSLPAIEKFESLINKRTKAILINNPCNPTGAVYSQSMIEQLVDLVHRKDLFLIADEVYRDFLYDGSHFTSILTYPEISDRAIVLDSVSKRYSMCGARIGAMVCRNGLIRDQFLKLAQARLCPPTIEQYAACAAVDVSPAYMKSVLSEYKHRRDVLIEEVQRIDGVTCSRPEGAFYLIIELPVDDAEDFARFLLTDFELDRQTVMVTPAEGFYETEGAGKSQVRMAYVLCEQELRISARILKEGLQSYMTRS